MKEIKFFLIGICMSYSFFSFSQDLDELTFTTYDDSGDELINPFSGGYDLPQFSEVDLNNDGIMDLYVFDDEGEVSSTYINTGSDYVYAHEYVAAFPDMKYAVLLRDYNNDGAMDIFTHSGDELIDSYKVYQGYFDNDNKLNFTLFNFYSPLGNSPTYFDLDGNEQILIIDDSVYPSIDDIDGDGDLDIISIQKQGGYIEYYQNISVENGWGLDSLQFVVTAECFGGALEDGGDLTFALSNVQGECVPMLLGQNTALHGGFSFLTFDNDGDGDKDLLYGDKLFSQMNLLTNGGSNTEAFFTMQDTVFPSNSTAIDAMVLPVSFYVDANLDGEKDLLVSSRLTGINTDGYSLYYENFGTTDNPIFGLEEEDWLTNTSIDYGKVAHPTFTDYNQDGLMDLVLASQTNRLDPTAISCRLILFENTGTLTAPEFTLVDLDWLGLSDYGSFWLRPSFGDMDNDNDQDLVIGEADGKLIYLENNAGENNPYSFEAPIYNYMDIDVTISIGITANPQIIDLDEDGLNDLVLGMRQGNIVFFKNIGSVNNPNFDPDPMATGNEFQLGGVSIGISGTAVPYITDVDGEKTMYIGDVEGKIWKYGNINNNLGGTFDLETDNWEGINVGTFASPTFVDIDRNGFLDVFVGNFRGGMNAYATTIYVGNEATSIFDVPNTKALEIYPNPSDDRIFFSLDEEFEEIVIYNALGQVVKLDTQDISDLASGLYTVSVQTLGNRYVGQFIKK